jgi:hypothetical protein
VNYLIDTNIISEVRKGDQCNRNVAAWYASVDDAEIYLSVLVLGEIRKGIERARSRDPARAGALERWLSTGGCLRQLCELASGQMPVGKYMVRVPAYFSGSTCG